MNKNQMINADEPILATGRRKTSVAQIRLVRPGQGKVTINSGSVEEYFRGMSRYQNMVLSPFAASGDSPKCDIYVKVAGGGISGQAGAIRHGIARAFSKLGDNVKAAMKKAGFLTRDPRMVERKKPGQPKARKRFQYSKR